MCEVIIKDWSHLDTRFLTKLLSKKRKFPDCGIRYSTLFEWGIVIIRNNYIKIPVQQILEKAAAANPVKSYVYIMPKEIEQAMQCDIPLLTEVA